MLGSTLQNLRSLVIGLSLAATAFGVGCAAPEEVEARGSTTSKLLAPYKAVETPASVTADFVKALNVAPVEIDRWQGFVAGTIEESGKDNALFAVHLSGLDGDKPVAGITVALVEEGTPTAAGDFDERFAKATKLEVRFNNGSGIVSTHSFNEGRSVSPHLKDPESDSLLKRAFNDSTALLSAPKSIAGDGADETKSCLANYLELVRNATRCVNDAANVDECNAVRTDAANTAATCAGAKTANILAEAEQADDDGEGSAARTGAVRPQFFGAIANFVGNVFGNFFDVGGVGGKIVQAIPDALGAITGSKAVESLADKIVGGKGIIDSVLTTLGEKQTLSEIGSLLPKLFGNAPTVGRVTASPNTGAVTAQPKSKAQLARERARAAAAK